MSVEPEEDQVVQRFSKHVTSKMLGGFATFLITQRSGASFTKPKRSDQNRLAIIRKGCES